MLNLVSSSVSHLTLSLRTLLISFTSDPPPLCSVLSTAILLYPLPIYCKLLLLPFFLLPFYLKAPSGKKRVSESFNLSYPCLVSHTIVNNHVIVTCEQSPHVHCFSHQIYSFDKHGSLAANAIIVW